MQKSKHYRLDGFKFIDGTCIFIAINMIHNIQQSDWLR